MTKAELMGYIDLEIQATADSINGDFTNEIQNLRRIKHLVDLEKKLEHNDYMMLVFIVNSY